VNPALRFTRRFAVYGTLEHPPALSYDVLRYAHTRLVFTALTMLDRQEREQAQQSALSALLDAAAHELAGARADVDALLKAALTRAERAPQLRGELSLLARDSLKALFGVIIGNTVALKVWPPAATDVTRVTLTLNFLTHPSYFILKFDAFKF
jgi:type IV secretory pathway VirJ component